MKKLLEAEANGPLIIVLEYLSFRELVEKSAVCQSFSATFETALRIKKFTEQEHREILSMDSGCGDLLLKKIMAIAEHIDFSFILTYQVVKRIDFLSYSIYKGFMESFIFILENSLVKFLDKHLTISCNIGRIDMVKYFVEKMDIDPSMNENYPLFCASTENHFELSKYLLDFESVQEMGIGERNTICHCSRYGHFEVLKLLMTVFDKAPIPPLALDFSVEGNYYKLVELLLTDGRLDPQKSNNALGIACQKGHLEIVKLLLKDGRVDPSRKNNFGLRWSSRNGHEEIVKLLLQEEKVDLNDPDNEVVFNNTLIEAVQSNNATIVELILSSYDYPMITDSDVADRAVRIALDNSSLEVIKVLIGDMRVRSLVNLLEFSRLAVAKQDFEISKFLFVRTKFC